MGVLASWVSGGTVLGTIRRRMLQRKWEASKWHQHEMSHSGRQGRL
jgi:hypothetical protein